MLSNCIKLFWNISLYLIILDIVSEEEIIVDEAPESEREKDVKDVSPSRETSDEPRL